MRKEFIIIAALFTLPFISSGQNYDGRIILGEQGAKQALKRILSDRNHKAFYDTLIKNRETAIAVVEPILFEIYGNEHIIREKPYECYLINGYWYITGTFPKNRKGGVFEIVISSKNGRIMNLTHGQ